MKGINIYIKANALQYAIFLSIVTLLLLFSFLLFINLNSILSLRTDNIINGIDSQISQIYKSKNNTVKIYTQKWGAFNIQKVESIQKEEGIQRPFKTVYLSTPSYLNDSIDQVYLPSFNNGKLQITGNTILEGNLSVPNNDIRATSVAGFIYTGSTYLNAETKSSLSVLPESKIIDYIDYLNIEQDSIIAFDKSNVITRSFKKRGVTIASDNSIFLDNHDYRGFVKIVSNKQIIVSENTILEDVAIIAPVIKFKKGFTGKVHAVARDSILIDENVNLNFPSSLTIANSNYDNKPSIVIEKNSIVEGFIKQFKKVSELDSYSQLFINKNAIVRGSIYNVANTELRGTVEGSIYTNSFVAYIDARIYRNYIFDGKVLKTEWFDTFSKGLILSNENSNTPMKWLY